MGSQTMDMQIQIQSIADEVKDTRMRIERMERRIQMLTDSFVVSGLWRTTSHLEDWKNIKEEEVDMLQFEMAND
jgi:predicted  nucleic acid-binding Zn-ribbon protein